MRLYKITASDGADEREIHWVGSKADGVASRKQLAAAGWQRREISEVEVDVPTNKEGLLQWLNAGGSAA
jgi:hypothetical protein